jgi:alpha-N-arabinofuranosidase
MKATLRIQTDRVLARASDNLRGLFLEKHHRCVEGGIYEPNSPLSDERGFRRDVLESLHALRPGVVRFPGGNFACDYDWRDGVLPIEERPVRLNYGTGFVTDYRFGTHEFLEYCRALGATPMLTTNAGTGTPSLAADWVQYCNADDDSHYARLRRANGYEEPWRVPYWCIGNEMYGDWIPGTMTGEEYGRFARESAKLMKLADPDIQLIGMASGTYLPDWDHAALDATVDIVDMVALHIYVGRRNFTDCMGGAAAIQYGIDVTHGAIEAAACKKKLQKPPKISLDEYNIWYRTRNNAKDRLAETFNLQDALAMASIQHVLYRNADKLGAACLSFPINTLGAVMTNDDSIFRQTIYWPLYFAAKYFAAEVVDCFVDCPTFSARHPRTFPGIVDVDEAGEELHSAEQRTLFMDFENLPYLDACATFDKAQNRLMLSVVNRHETQDIEADLQVLGMPLSGMACGEVLTAASAKSENSFEYPDEVQPQPIASFAVSNQFGYTFPARSQTILSFNSPQP